MIQKLNIKIKAIFLAALLLTIALLPIFSINVEETAIADFYSDDAYLGDNDYSTEIETFDYAYKQTTSYLINSNFPNYYNSNATISNACAPVAGSNIIGYFDRYYENLVPNCAPGIERGTNYTFYPMSVSIAQKQAVINSLYELMGTNTEQPGTSQNQFKDGLKKYVGTKSRSISYNSVMTSNRFDLTELDFQLRNGNPVVLYLKGYNFSTISDLGNTVELHKKTYQGNHIVVVYGYSNINYFNSNGMLIKNKVYLNVSSGIMGISGCYIVDNNGILNDAEAVQIY